MTRLATAVLVSSAMPAFADTEMQALHFAGCIGQADAYIQAASDYADMGVVADANAAQYAAILPVIGDTAAAETARADGRRAWRKRADALMAAGGPMEGPLWDAQVEATLKCAALRKDLVAAGILEDG